MADYDEIRQQMELLKDDELAAILQEHNEEEWRPEVFDIVAAILKARGISLSGASEPGENALDDAAGLDRVIVTSYFNYLDAETDRLALEVKGLKAWIVNRDASMNPAVPGVELQVLSEDLTAAMAILESEPAPSTDLPPELAEPPCPKCGSRKVTEEAEIMEVPTISHGVLQKEVWLYICASCGHKWSEP